LLFAVRAGALFAQKHGHKVLDRLHGQHFGPLVADDLFLFAALAAGTLLRRTGDDPLHALKMAGKFIAAGMLLAGARCLCDRCIVWLRACGSIRQRAAVHFTGDLFAGHTWLASQ
jgi:hypothetical protein